LIRKKKVVYFLLVLITLSIILGACKDNSTILKSKYSVQKIFSIDELGTLEENANWNVISIKGTYLIAEQRYSTLTEDYTIQVVRYDLQTNSLKQIVRFNDRKVVILSAEYSTDGYYFAGYELFYVDEVKARIKSFIYLQDGEQLRTVNESWIETVFETDILYEYLGKVYAFVESLDDSNIASDLTCSELVRLSQTDKISVYKDCDGFYPKDLRNTKISESGIILFEIKKNESDYEFRSVSIDFEGNVRGVVTYNNPVSVFVDMGDRLITTYWDVNNKEAKTDVSMIDVSDINGKNVNSIKLFTPKNADQPNIVYGCEPLDHKTMLCNTAYELNDDVDQTMASTPYIVTLNNYELEFEKLPVDDEYPTHLFVRINDSLAFMGTYVIKEGQKAVYTIFEIRKEN
jgi:hypothetical protein